MPVMGWSMLIADSFWDSDGLLHVQPGESSENGMLFTFEHAMVANIKVPDGQMNNIYQIHKAGDHFKQNTYGPDSDLASHDNITGMLMYAVNDLDRWNDGAIDDFKSRIYHSNYLRHPRDIVTYASVFWWRPLSHLLLPFHFFTCYRHYKVRNGVKIVKTDGEKLAFLRMTAFGSAFQMKVCTWLLKRRFGEKPWARVYETYFKNVNHPTRLAAQERWK
jgi:hypothetical protein